MTWIKMDFSQLSPPPPRKSKYITTREAAKIAREPIEVIRMWIRDEEFKAWKNNRRWKIGYNSFMKFIRARMAWRFTKLNLEEDG